MNNVTILIMPIVLLFNTLLSDVGCVEYKRIEKKKKAVGYSHVQDLISLCRSDSTFKQTIQYQRRKADVVKIMNEEINVGKWQIRMDTLILTYPISESKLAIVDKYIINKNGLTHISNSLLTGKYKWKRYAGQKDIVFMY